MSPLAQSSSTETSFLFFAKGSSKYLFFKESRLECAAKIKVKNKIKRINDVRKTLALKNMHAPMLLTYDKRPVGSFHSILSHEGRMKENWENLT